MLRRLAVMPFAECHRSRCVLSNPRNPCARFSDVQRGRKKLTKRESDALGRGGKLATNGKRPQKCT